VDLKAVVKNANNWLKKKLDSQLFTPVIPSYAVSVKIICQ
jgi:hypothetical protein